MWEGESQGERALWEVWVGVLTLYSIMPSLAMMAVCCEARAQQRQPQRQTHVSVRLRACY